MKEIVEEVLRVEEKASSLLREARQKAAETRSSSEEKAAELVSRAKRDAKAELQEALEAAKSEAEKSRKEILEKAKADLVSRDIRHSPEFERAVSRVLDILSAAEYREDR